MATGLEKEASKAFREWQALADEDAGRLMAWVERKARFYPDTARQAWMRKRCWQWLTGKPDASNQEPSLSLNNGVSVPYSELPNSAPSRSLAENSGGKP